MNPVAGIIRIFGSQSALGRVADVAQPTVAGWLRAGHIPARRQQQILQYARTHGIKLAPDDFFPPAEESAA